MAKSVRGRYPATKPFTPQGVQSEHNWIGVPGARHIPPSSDPRFAAFTSIVAEFSQAGIEMTDELMAAAAQLATARLDRAMRRQAADARTRALNERIAATPAPPPGTYGDAAGGWVYYVRRASFVKIGTTTRLRPRMQDLMPDEVLAVEPGSYKLEGELHQQFAHLRVRATCEYFHYREDLQAHVQAVLSRVGPPPAGLDIGDLLGDADPQ